MHGQQKIF